MGWGGESRGYGQNVSYRDHTVECIFGWVSTGPQISDAERSSCIPRPRLRAPCWSTTRPRERPHSREQLHHPSATSTPIDSSCFPRSFLIGDRQPIGDYVRFPFPSRSDSGWAAVAPHFDTHPRQSELSVQGLNTENKSMHITFYKKADAPSRPSDNMAPYPRVVGKNVGN